MRTHKDEAIIIKRRNFGEADRMVTMFTRGHGKIAVKATGIRKIASRRSSHVELLNHTEISLYVKNNFYTLIEAQGIESFREIKEDLAKVGIAYHLCELIDGLLPDHEPNEQVFFLFRNVLQRLCVEDDVPQILHDFEVELLRVLGFWHKNHEESQNLNTHSYIEQILERKLKSRSIFGKME